MSLRFAPSPPEPRARVHVAIRLVVFVALALIGWRSVTWLAYLALPVLAALLIAQKGAERYLGDDLHPLARFLGWLAHAYAYLFLLTDEPPTTKPGGPVELSIEPSGTPTPASAMLRLIYSLPALLLLALLWAVAGLLWIVGAIAILAVRRAPAFVFDFIAMTVRYELKLIAYHLSLVDRYPSFEEAGSPQLTGPSVAKPANAT